MIERPNCKKPPDVLVAELDTSSVRLLRTRGANLLANEATALVGISFCARAVSSLLGARARIGSGMVRTGRFCYRIDRLAPPLRMRLVQEEPVHAQGPPCPPSRSVRSVKTFLTGCP